MSLKFDHAVIAVKDLDGAIQDYRDLGFTVFRGGVHANRATENALIVFEDGTYLELLARTNEQPIVGLVDFSVLLNNGEGLVGYALGSDDLEADSVRLKTSGFQVGDIISGERRRGDGVLIQWKLALIDDGFAPFLIQDVTPRELRVSNDPTHTTHENRAVGVRGVVLAVRSKDESKKRYEGLFGVEEYNISRQPMIGAVSLREYEMKSSKYPPGELPDYIKRTLVRIAQAEAEAIDRSLEPKELEQRLESDKQMVAHFHQEAAEERAMASALGEQQEGLFELILVREQGKSDAFTLERTHNVRYLQVPGVPPTRGENILVGLRDFDWSRFDYFSSSPRNTAELLRGMTSDDKEVREDAFHTLFGNTMPHHGSPYEAFIETVPFLMQLLTAPEVEDKKYPVHLLMTIAFGGLFTPGFERQTKAQLNKALPTLLTLVDHPDERVRSGVEFVLGMFDTEVKKIEPVLKERMTLETDPAAKASLLNSLASLWRSIYKNLSAARITYVVELMRDTSQPLELQLQAAHILLEVNAEEWLDESLKVFEKVLRNDEDILAHRASLHLMQIFFAVTGAMRNDAERRLAWVTAQTQHLNAEVRVQAVKMLKSLDRPYQTPLKTETLMRLLRDPSPDVRLEAVGCCFSRENAVPQEVIEQLKEMSVHDPSHEIRLRTTNAVQFHAQGRRWGNE